MARKLIDISHISKSYGDNLVLDDLNLYINENKFLTLLGPSGCGKSTLVKLLAGLLKYDSGHICFDGTELNEICLNDLYSKMSYLSQDAPVFDGTIRENLVFDKSIPDSELYEALKRVQLLDLLESAEKGIDTEIGEKGTLLSGGEKQRLALARLWFEESAVVILDEATSAMDNLTEELVMKEIIGKLNDCTVIAIAHRLNSIKGFDRIIVFREGEIVAQGTFEELLNTNSYFAELYNANVR